MDYLLVASMGSSSPMLPHLVFRRVTEEHLERVESEVSQVAE